MEADPKAHAGLIGPPENGPATNTLAPDIKPITSVHVEVQEKQGGSFTWLLSCLASLACHKVFS